MVITPTVRNILIVLRRYKFLNRAQIQRLFFPKDKDGSVTRNVLRKIKHAGLCRALHPPENSSAPVVYVPTDAGCSVLAAETGDVSYLLDCQPNTKAWVSFHHFLAVTDLFIKFDKALQNQTYVSMPCLFFEHDILNPDASDPKTRFKLYTQISEKIVCVPDAACDLRVASFCRAYYWELERGTDSPMRVAAKKTPGYFGLSQGQHFKRHFAHAQDMRVVAVCPNGPWRDALRKAMRDKPGAEFWLFAAVNDLSAETFLHAPVFYTAAAEHPKPLVKAPEGAPLAAPSGQKAPGAEKGHHDEK